MLDPPTCPLAYIGLGFFRIDFFGVSPGGGNIILARPVLRGESIDQDILAAKLARVRYPPGLTRLVAEVRRGNHAMPKDIPLAGFQRHRVDARQQCNL